MQSDSTVLSPENRLADNFQTLSMQNIFGWGLLFNIIKDTISTKAEVIIAFVHWSLATLTDDEKSRASELLPEDWNKTKKVYFLRYVLDDTLYVLHSIDCGNMVLFNLLNVSKNTLTNVVINVESHVKTLVGSVDDVLSNYPDLIHKINTHLLEKIAEESTKTASTQTEDYSVVKESPISTSLHANSPRYPPPNCPIVEPRYSLIDEIINTGLERHLNPLRQPQRRTRDMRTNPDPNFSKLRSPFGNFFDEDMI